MRTVGWTRHELNDASTEDVVRIMWVLDAERLAKLAERFDEGAAMPLPEGPDRAGALLDRDKLAQARDQIDGILFGPLE